MDWKDLIKNEEVLGEAAIGIISKLNMMLQGLANHKVDDARKAIEKIKAEEKANKDLKAVESYLDSLNTELSNPKLKDISMVKAKVKKEVDKLK